MATIRLTYFKPSGKYYSEGETDIDNSLAGYEIFMAVRELQKTGRLPGLCEDAGKEFFVHVDASAHPNGYPAIIIPEPYRTACVDIWTTPVSQS